MDSSWLTSMSMGVTLSAGSCTAGSCTAGCFGGVQRPASGISAGMGCSLQDTANCQLPQRIMLDG